MKDPEHLRSFVFALQKAVSQLLKETMTLLSNALIRVRIPYINYFLGDLGEEKH